MVTRLVAIVLALLTVTMPTTSIYSLQQFVTAFTKVGSYHSTAQGGGDATITGYPEITSAENIKTVAGAGPTGQNVVDKDHGDYYLSGACFLGLGSLSNGQFDVRIANGALYLKMKVKLLAAAASASGYGSVEIASGGASGTDGETRNNDWVLQLEYSEDGAPNVQWNLNYYHPNGATFQLVAVNPSLTTAPYVFDDGWHTLIISIVPATVTGVFSGIGTVGSATVAHDGSVSFSIDGVTVLSATSIDIVVNKFSNTQPDLYYGRGFWLGDGGSAAGADLIGPTTDIEMYYETVAPLVPPVPNVSTTQPCCDNNMKTSTTTKTGDIETGHGWDPQCADDGAVDTAADLTDPEEWED